MVVVALSALLNIALQIRFPVTQRLSEQAATFLLAFDVLQLAALLYLTGGLENPFAFMFLGPVLIAATTLEPKRTVMLGALATACAAFLIFEHMPLPWRENEGALQIPQLYVYGGFTAILLGLVFISIYAWRVAEESRQLSDAISATELALSREQSLSAIDGLAAAAAHQLGTPLATIALIVNEMDKLEISDPEIKDDIAILREQADRCREILARIASLGEETASPFTRQSLSHLIDEAAAPYRGFEKEIIVDTSGLGDEPFVQRNPALLYGLGNIIENAVDFSQTRLRIEARWSKGHISIAVEDDGPGFAPEILSRLGEPYLSSRRADRAEGRGDSGRIESGLGLGLFIAKTLIERSGGMLLASNTGPPAGARVEVRWPRGALEDTVT